MPVETSTLAVRKASRSGAGVRRRTPRRRFLAPLLVSTLALGSLITTATPASAGTAPRVSDCAGLFANGDPNAYLGPGSRNVCVASLQHFLRSLAWITGELYYHPGPIDSVYGPKTQEAVKFYQLVKYFEHGGLNIIKRDGLAGRQTWQFIRDDCITLYAQHGALFCYVTVNY